MFGGAPRGSTSLNGLFEAVVLSVDPPKSARVRLLHVNSTLQYKASCAEGIWTAGLDTKPTVVDGGTHADYYGDGWHTHGPHTHRLGADLKAGDRVIVALLHGRSDAPFIIARIPR